MQFDKQIQIQYLGNISSWDVPIFGLIFVSIMIHTLFFCFLPSSITPMIKSYIISTFHALIGVTSVLYFFLNYSVNLKQINRVAGGGIYGTGDEIMIYSLCYSFGYFIYDLLIMLFYKSVRTNTALIHHILLISVLSLGILNCVCRPCHFYLLFEELSTIALNLKTIYYDRTNLHNTFTMLFVVSFFLCRIIYGSIICGYALRSAGLFAQMALDIGDLKNTFFVLLQISLCVLSRILNFYWAILILRKMFRSKRSKTKHESLNKKTL
ncbi:unnamed protein product [Adineta steineri]|uniref:TLC domain-containing protein n=1 Tax=Adineta steineri TaxID=433720 RepID=A0A815SXD8_9BILA|nr:unnamed protein product [Adineta steineri]CAF1494524.1 unnamed protein product [Adineta steineri]